MEMTSRGLALSARRSSRICERLGSRTVTAAEGPGLLVGPSVHARGPGVAADLRDIVGYHEEDGEVGMTDVLIRDVPDDVIAAVDANAGRLGLSRSEYLRRRLAQDAATPGSRVSADDLARFAETFGDLADPDVMSRAWQ